MANLYVLIASSFMGRAIHLSISSFYQMGACLGKEKFFLSFHLRCMCTHKLCVNVKLLTN